eukprot:1392331-Amorphochlora_amoeboformis.AAC.1
MFDKWRKRVDRFAVRIAARELRGADSTSGCSSRVQNIDGLLGSGNHPSHLDFGAFWHQSQRSSFGVSRDILRMKVLNAALSGSSKTA